jgi:hypothetical protein
MDIRLERHPAVWIVQAEHDRMLREMFMASIQDQLNFQRELAYNLIKCPSFMASLPYGTNIRKKHYQAGKER